MSDLIKRSDAIEAIEVVDWYHQNRNKDMVSGANDEHQAWYKADDIYKALEAVPSADRPSGEVDAVKEYERQVHNLDQGYITLGEFDKRVEPLRHLYYDRPQGEWRKRFGSINCSACGKSHWSACFEDLVRSFNYCPNCGAKMKGVDDE